MEQERSRIATAPLFHLRRESNGMRSYAYSLTRRADKLCPPTANVGTVRTVMIQPCIKKGFGPDIFKGAVTPAARFPQKGPGRFSEKALKQARQKNAHAVAPPWPRSGILPLNRQDQFG